MDQMDENPMKWVEEIRKYSERLSKKYLTQIFIEISIFDKSYGID